MFNGSVMHINVIPPVGSDTPDVLREVLSLPTAGGLLLRQLHGQADARCAKTTDLWVPAEWLDRIDKSGVRLRAFGQEGLPVRSLNGSKDGVQIVNARLSCRVDPHKLNALLDPTGTAVVAVHIAPQLAASSERVCRTSNNRIVGFRRILEDSVEPHPGQSRDFPAILYIPPAILNTLGPDEAIPLDPDALAAWLSARHIPLRPFRLGGDKHNLDAADGLLRLLSQIPADSLSRVATTAVVDSAARIIGPVWIDDGVRIENNAIVIGPSILCKDVRIGAGAVVQHAIVAPTLTVNPGIRLQNSLCLSHGNALEAASLIAFSSELSERSGAYRDWPMFSYPRLVKRLFDIIFSLGILLLISPIFPVIALMLKLTSQGPVFYPARRQGRRGKEFNCLKFRTMMVQADSLQERLRVVNQVDGPQFKIENDPRITGVGKFLRDTCIDELPQFINVLLGQMSVVGPRPSPENENESCPAWRDARLSVRPGITGLWQVRRTRQASMDFQEWVYYDTLYVRNLSLRQDIWICLKTASKLINTFLDQFG
jgi:lipopolysaccharide/colanic/teichoic acid biosynthesis glycosyltransferase